MRYSLTFNTGTYSYNFYYKHCYNLRLMSLTCCTFILINLKWFSNCLCHFFVILIYVNYVHFYIFVNIPNCFIDLIFNQIPCGQKTYFLLYWIFLSIWTILENIDVHLRKMSVWFWVECSIAICCSVELSASFNLYTALFRSLYLLIFC